MPGKPFQGVISYLRRKAAPGGSAGVSDAQLLGRYAEQRDESAFELLVWRHAWMVLGTCRRILLDEHRIEDCFQAAFLALAKEARSIASRESVGGWLHKVAFRLALKAKATAENCPVGEGAMADVSAAPGVTDPSELAAWRELAPVLDEQISRLPGKYREAFILRCLAGKSSAEAAGELGCPVGTVESRLTRARERLRAALVRRGFAVRAGLLAAGLCSEASAAGPPTFAVSATVKAATLFAAGRAVGGAASPRVVALAKWVLRGTLMKKMQGAVALVLALAVLGFGTVTVGRCGSELRLELSGTALARAPAPIRRPAKKEDKELIQGTWKSIMVEVNGKHTAQEISDDQRWVIGADRITVHYGDGAKEFVYRLEPKSRPKGLRLMRADRPVPEVTYRAIYELDGDRLKVCYTKAVGQRPTDFRVTGENDRGRLLFVLKRVPAPRPAGKTPQQQKAGKDKKEGDLRGVVDKVVDGPTGKVLVLEGGVRVAVDQGTRYLIETGDDPRPAKLSDVIGKEVLIGTVVQGGKRIATVVMVVWPQVTGTAQAAGQEVKTPAELIRGATKPVSGDSHPALPALSTAMLGRVAGEIEGSRTVRAAYAKLAAGERNVTWFEGVKELEMEKAVWCLASCLCHPHPDVQIRALQSLERLGDKRPVEFVVLYGEYMAVLVEGSENATIHGIIHTTASRTLSALTGVKVTLRQGQDPEGLKRACRRWRKWLLELAEKERKVFLWEALRGSW